jgi:signal transduction histidine kinase
LRSVRARLVALAALSVAVALAVAGAALVLLVRSSLEHPMRGEARARAADVVAALTVVPMPTTVPPLPAPWPTLVQVVADDGSVLAASADLAGRAPLLVTSPERREPSGGASIVSNGRRQNWRLDAVVASLRGRPVTVIVATSLAQVERSTRLIVVALWIGAPILVLLVGALAWTLVGRSFRPVETLRRDVAGFDHGPAGRRVAAPTDDDEIGRLAATLNALLDRLERANAQQRRFVADASHELRSPVANIRAALEVALAHPDATPWPDVATDVLEQNERMRRLVDDLLLLARVEAGELGRRDDEVDLGALAGRVVAARSRGGAPAAVPVRVEVVDGAVTRGDEGQLERVVENLVANAVRHARTQVTVTVSATSRWALVAVADDGPGVPADERSRIFQPFVRLDADRSRAAGGTGLGLAIVAEIVAAHGGSVRVDDTHPGAVFTIRLPVSPQVSRGVPVVSASP